MGGGVGTPFSAHYVGFLTMGPKLDPLLHLPFFACRPFKNSCSILIISSTGCKRESLRVVCPLTIWFQQENWKKLRWISTKFGISVHMGNISEEFNNERNLSSISRTSSPKLKAHWFWFQTKYSILQLVLLICSCRIFLLCYLNDIKERIVGLCELPSFHDIIVKNVCCAYSG